MSDASQMPGGEDLILHHYSSSPFAEKARLMLGLKGLAYERVEVPFTQNGGYQPKPPAVLAANHSGAVPFDSAMIWADVVRHTDPPRVPRPVADHFVPMIPDIGTETHALPVPYADIHFNLGGLVLGATQLVVMATTAVLCGLLYLMFKYSRVGIAMQATSQNQLAAYYMGIPVKRLNSLVWALAAVVATIAGLLLALSSEAFCFLANGISKIAVIVIVALMQIDTRAVKASGAPLLRAMKEGVSYATALMPVRVLLPIVALMSFMASPYQALMPIFAAEVFKGDARMLGFLIGAAGFGGSSALIYLAARKNVRGLSSHIVVGMLMTGSSLMVFGESQLLWLSLTAIWLTGFGIILVAMSTSMILQTIVSDEKRGRVMAFYMMAFLGTAPFGSLIAGTLSSHVGAPHTLLVGGAFARDKGNARLLGHGASFSGSARFVIRIINLMRFRPVNLLRRITKRNE